MADINLLKSYFVRHGYKQSDIAKELGMSNRTLSSRLKSGVFGSDEIAKLITILEIDNPIEVFFKN